MTDVSARPGTHDVRIADLRLDGGTQARAALDEDTIADYAALYKAGVVMPPVEAYRDDKGVRWLANGFHRVYAAQRAGKDAIATCTYKGSQRDAILHAAGANADHGLRRTNADKRRAVEMLLRDREWSKWSDRKLAEAAGVHHETVADVRRELAISPVERAARKDPTKESGRPSVASAATAEDSLGDEGAGAAVSRDAEVAPAPDEPAIEMHGLEAVASWGFRVRFLLAFLRGNDTALRQMVGETSAIAEIAPVRQAAQLALQEAGAKLRALAPHCACVFCRDPDGTAGRRRQCSACGDLGWLTKEQAQRIPPGQLAPDAKPVVKAAARLPQVAGRGGMVIEVNGKRVNARELIVEREPGEDDAA